MAYPTGELTVDLHAIVCNWRLLKSKLAETVDCGAVVKANAYGLGVDRIAPRIYQAGCRNFFVANLKEAMQLQSLIGLDANVFVLTGCIAGSEPAFISRNLIPVIISEEMLYRWSKFSKQSDDARAVLKVDTGMGRLGIGLASFNKIAENHQLLKDSRVKYLMSHFACADEHDHPRNKIQCDRFQSALKLLNDKGFDVKATLANSAGVFLGDYAHGDIVRPGIALYGGNPGLDKNPMKPVVGLSLPIVQVHDVDAGEPVGYGATVSFASPRKVAVVSGGYADGMMRSLSNRGWGYIDKFKVPIVGRISMDTTIFDVTDVEKTKPVTEGMAVEILGEHVSIDDLAGCAGTISYEVLTSFGARYQRAYIE